MSQGRAGTWQAKRMWSTEVMMKRFSWLLGGGLLIGLLALGAYTAVGLLTAQGSEDDLEPGLIVYEDVFDDGSGSPVTVRTIIEPAAELPARPAEASGIFLRQEDNSYFVGTGSTSVNVNIVNGERSVAVDHSGPEVEVVTHRETSFYRDITEVDYQATESVERRYQQQLRLEERPETMPQGGSFAAWGEKRGDRVVADMIVFGEAGE
jgi:hypothetical protein